jgi:hypothetical protein
MPCSSAWAILTRSPTWPHTIPRRSAPIASKSICPVRSTARDNATAAGQRALGFQKATLDYLLARKGGIDGDQPGLGKTPTAIVYCNAREAHRVLVICPASVRIQWGERIREWSTIPNVKASVMLRVKDGIHPTAHYQVISYDAARNPAIIRAISKYKWDVLICDEAHKMKNIEALTTRAIVGNSRGEYQHGEIKVPAIAKHCREHLALTGTLLLNRPSEAYVLFRFFDWEAIDFASEDKFKERYNKQADMKTIEGKRFKLESTSLESELQNRLRVNVMARHEKKDVLTFMKPPRFSVVTCAENGAVRGALDVKVCSGYHSKKSRPPKISKFSGTSPKRAGSWAPRLRRRLPTTPRFSRRQRREALHLCLASRRARYFRK